MVSAGAETVNRILAVVNGEVITEADVMSRVTMLLEQQQADGRPTEGVAGQMKNQILERLIEQRLMLQEAKRLELSVPYEQVTQHLEEFKREIGSEETFEQFLEQEGLNEMQLKERIREQLLVDAAVDRQVRSTITISPQEVSRLEAASPQLQAEAPGRVLLSCLLVRVGEARDEAKARALIESLQQQLQGGATFSELAARHSEDAYAQDGGAMGWMEPADLLPELGGALKPLKPGEVSPPIRSALGFHLLKVHERGEAQRDPALLARSAAYQQLYRQKFKQAFDRWMAQLKRRAYIETPSGS
ncbi:MAG: peptidylprolyl isomerase [Candidatus Omnitrophica bacterium]|nr:peptidylprolyl isomerase [Candidatus Omnitrophota bacterium]